MALSGFIPDTYTFINNAIWDKERSTVTCHMITLSLDKSRILLRFLIEIPSTIEDMNEFDNIVNYCYTKIKELPEYSHCQDC